VGVVRIATWNVNSLKARLEKLAWWLGRAEPDVLLMQETKLTDADFPGEFFDKLGYHWAHHGEGRWNGVAVISRSPIGGVISNFGQPRPEGRTPEAGDDEPLAEARMISVETAGLRVVSIYAPNGRVVDSPFYRAKLRWYERLSSWLAEACGADQPLVVGGDLNVAPTDADVWDATKCHGGTHVSPAERAAFDRLIAWGLKDGYRLHHPERERFTWWDYRAGMFHKNFGMRIDHLLLTAPLAARVVWAEIDREARKGTPTPSDHAPLLIDVDAPGPPLDAGWAGAEARIAARRGPAGRSR
jgi:exodeoxyribonuclease III